MSRLVRRLDDVRDVTHGREADCDEGGGCDDGVRRPSHLVRLQGVHDDAIALYPLNLVHGVELDCDVRSRQSGGQSFRRHFRAVNGALVREQLGRELGGNGDYDLDLVGGGLGGAVGSSSAGQAARVKQRGSSISRLTVSPQSFLGTLIQISLLPITVLRPLLSSIASPSTRTCREPVRVLCRRVTLIVVSRRPCRGPFVRVVTQVVDCVPVCRLNMDMETVR